MKTIDNDKWDRVISGRRSLLDFQLDRVWEYRDLILLFVKRDFITYYKQTIFGPLWYLLQPICSTIMYMLIFGTLANIGTDSVPQVLFYFSGTMLWTFFSGNLKEVSNVFTTNKNIFGKVFFPRLVVPIATTISLLIKLGIQFFLFLLLYAYYLINGMRVTSFPKIFLFPIVILWISVFSCGIGMIISSITTKYKDLALILDFFISLAMYAAPVVYPLSEVPNNIRLLVVLNPVSVMIELFRYCFFGVASITNGMVLYSFLSTVSVILVGLLMFNHNERTFIDVI